MALFDGEPSTYPSIAVKQQYFAWRLWVASASVELREYLVWYLRQLCSVNARVKVPRGTSVVRFAWVCSTGGSSTVREAE